MEHGHTVEQDRKPESTVKVDSRSDASDPQQTYSHKKVWRTYGLNLLLWVSLSILFGSIIVILDGQNPLNVYGTMLREAFLTPTGLMIAIQRATPYILTSAAAVMAFQGGAINMGLDGQFMVGAALGAVAGFALPDLPKPIMIPLILLISAAGGAAAGFIPAIFRRLSGVSEVITGMIANLIIPYLISWFLDSAQFLRSARAGASMEGIRDSAKLSQFTELTHGVLGYGTQANTGIFIALAIVVILAIWIKRSKLGFEIRMTRSNFSFAEFAGIRAGRSFFFAMMLSGAIAAMAGAIEILGIWRGYRLGTIAVGNKGLVVALAGGQNFFGSLIASLIYGGLESGAINAGFHTAIPRPLIDVLVEIIVIFAAIPSMRMFFSGTSFADVERLGGRFTSSQR
ncbi:MAG: hypothetical protein M1281_13155 [Chloroflexi bacterium]|nr:hypothetical protein [Chloroflexota bacterium]